MCIYKHIDMYMCVYVCLVQVGCPACPAASSAVSLRDSYNNNNDNDNDNSSNTIIIL